MTQKPPFPDPNAIDPGQIEPDVSNEATSANEPLAEPAAQAAQESPPAEDVVSDAVRPSDATVAAVATHKARSAVVRPPAAKPRAGPFGGVGKPGEGAM